jgi:hypothetical protein
MANLKTKNRPGRAAAKVVATDGSQIQQDGRLKQTILLESFFFDDHYYFCARLAKD